MGLKIRYDPKECVLRSVGDPPNGIVTLVTQPETRAHEFAISSTWQPPPPEGSEPMIRDHPPDSEHYECMATEEIVAALDSGREAGAIWGLVAASVQHKAAQMAMYPVGLLDLMEATTLVANVYRELVNSGWIAEGRWNLDG